MCYWPRLSGELLLCLWQKDRKDHECDEPLGREASKPRRASKMIDDQAGKSRTERGADTHYRAEHSLGEIETSGALVTSAMITDVNTPSTAPVITSSNWITIKASRLLIIANSSERIGSGIMDALAI